jgi:hypothetical protein
MSRNFPTALAALAHRAEGQCMFEGRNTECREVSNMTKRNTKVNHFQEGRARFETTIDLYEKESI